MEIRKADEDFYHKAALMAGLQKSYSDAQKQIKMGKNAEAVDALIRGIGKYDVNKELAGSLGIMDEYDVLEAQIEDSLKEFGIKYKKALELYDMDDRDAYTLAILDVVGEGTGN